jgi:hypothetical protein
MACDCQEYGGRISRIRWRATSAAMRLPVRPYFGAMLASFAAAHCPPCDNCF